MIRNLTTNDLKEFCRVRLNSLNKYPVAYSSMAQTFINASDDIKMAMLKDSESESSNFIKGYFKGDTLIGLIGLKRETRESVAHKGTMWGFYIEPEYQEKGYGKLLVQELFNEVKDDESLKYVRLQVADSCEKAIRLFKSAGFCQYGLEPESITDGTTFYDQIYMKINCEQ